MSEPNNQHDNHSGDAIDAAVNGVIHFCMDNKLIVGLVLAALVAIGLVVMPFDYAPDGLPRRRVPVDAIPDIGENQQIIFTEWMGRSPQDMEDQVTYPLTVSLLGVPGVETVRSVSMFGFSSVYVIFEEGIDFYWSRARLIERLNVAQGDLPEGVVPRLGPDATALGQVFWYTLEGRDPATGEPAGGWDLDELRSIQDWYVRYALQAAGGVAEVASVGGFVREYQVDVDPDAMRAFGVTLDQVYNAVRRSNVDVGARTIEINRVEYMIRGLGFLKGVEDLEQTVVTATDDVPVYLSNVAHVTTGPALRRGALDKGGAEAVGGVVVVRYGENPLEAIENVKQKIEEIGPGLPEKYLDDGRTSQVTIVPFYDRTELIHETLGTLEEAIRHQILVTIIVVLVMVGHMRSGMIISAMLPLAVMLSFIAMKLFGVDANIMSLLGVAIAVGTVVDMGVILCENMLRHLEEAAPGENRRAVLLRASREVGRPMLTALLTTVVAFLPVFAMTGPEGRLFKPLAYTTTFALLASVIVALTVIPPVAHLLFRTPPRWLRTAAGPVLITAGVAGGAFFSWWVALALGLWGGYVLLQLLLPKHLAAWVPRLAIPLAIAVVATVLTLDWMPLGVAAGVLRNFTFVILAVGGVLGGFYLFRMYYEPVLRFFLNHRLVFYVLPATTTLLALIIWLGFETIFGFLPASLGRVGLPEERIRANPAWVWAAHEFPGLGREFMPPLDEGSYLLMPTTMPHASIGEAIDVMRKQDMAISALPEVDTVVGKIGRVESPLDPAPISMVETIVTYKPEYKVDEAGRRLRFAYERRDGEVVFLRDEEGELIPHARGMPYRQWRDEIRTPDDIWVAIEEAARITGTTRAPRLQPISARIVMLQTGVRAPMAARIRGASLEHIEQVGFQVEQFLKEVPGVRAPAVVADRIVGKPYLEIDIDRAAIARYGMSIRDVQDVIETAIGGRHITTTVEGRERYPVRVRYQRELRDSIESIGGILVAGGGGSGAQVPLRQLAEIRYLRGPQAIKSEDTMLVGYVLFDREPGHSAVDVVEASQAYLEEKLAAGELVLPPGTEMPTFIGEYQNQVRAARTLAMIIPLAMVLIFIILYLQFRDVLRTLSIFTGVAVATSGAFILLYLYSVEWLGDIPLLGVEARTVFQLGTVNLSVAVWVGIIALMGIATDDEVVMTSYLNQSFRGRRTKTKQEIREATVQAGLRRVRPCLMTTATAMLALLPIITSTGRGSDVMVPMAIPTFGGMVLSVISLFFIPVTYSLIEEFKLRLPTTTEN